MEQYITYSENETKKLALKFAKKNNSSVIALTGELGAGKTIFVQGLAEGLGIKKRIISPTFVLIRQHKIPNSKKILYHIDLYRLDSLDSLNSLGLDEILSNEKNLVLIEWAEKATKYLPKNTVKITLEKIGKDQRKIIIS